MLQGTQDREKRCSALQRDICADANSNGFFTSAQVRQPHLENTKISFYRSVECGNAFPGPKTLRM